MDELGLVVDLKDEIAIVNIKRKSACGSCKACEMGRSNMSELNVEVKNLLGAQRGDHVRIQMQTPDILKAAFLVYMIPLLALLGVVTITYFIQQSQGALNEPMMIAVGLVLMVLSFFFVRKKDRQLKETETFEPVMTEVVKAIL